jgi:dihydrofolate synthase/folylpolyglutamate synthase
VDQAAPAGLGVNDAAVRSGLASVSWPARFQRVRRAPDLILDGAHNAASAAYLRETLGRLYPGRRVLAVIGLGADKDVEGFSRELGPALAAVYLTRSRTMKAAPAERLRRALSGFALAIAETATVAEALALALLEARSEDVVVVTGSFYVIAEAMTVLAGRERIFPA